MASGLARGAAMRGKRIAFGDGRKIIWDHNSETIFQRNPNIARPGTERSGGIEWVEFYKGKRIYNRQGSDRWIWNYDFKAMPGEIYFSREEKIFASKTGKHFVVIEPNVPAWKSVAPNKQWPVDRYDAVAKALKEAGHDVVQLDYGPGHRIPGVRLIATPKFRLGLAVLSRAGLYIGPEGGLHHGAAAFNKPAVVLFGGFIPPQVTGYDNHVNLTGGAEACGFWKPCAHCLAAMQAIPTEQVLEAAQEKLRRVAA